MNAIKISGVPGRGKKETNVLDDDARLNGITMLKFRGRAGVAVVVDVFREGVNVIAKVVRSTMRRACAVYRFAWHRLPL
jgi:hypothetical protein